MMSIDLSKLTPQPPQQQSAMPVKASKRPAPCAGLFGWRKDMPPAPCNDRAEPDPKRDYPAG